MTKGLIGERPTRRQETNYRALLAAWRLSFALAGAFTFHELYRRISMSLWGGTMAPCEAAYANQAMWSFSGVLALVLFVVALTLLALLVAQYGLERDRWAEAGAELERARIAAESGDLDALHKALMDAWFVPFVFERNPDVCHHGAKVIQYFMENFGEELDEHETAEVRQLFEALISGYEPENATPPELSFERVRYVHTLLRTRGPGTMKAEEATH